MLFIFFIIKKELYLPGISSNIKNDFAIGEKFSNLLIKCLLNISSLGAKDNLTTTNFL